ncbi:MAG: transcription antitermination factor NusB [Candidatus Adiutrix intracellularis]|nr:transcription antitermination factor NusB [Candidatus Adiutrix intracellularis]
MIWNAAEITEAAGAGPGKRPGIRRLARKLALSLLFQRDLEGGGTPEETVQVFESAFNPDYDEENALEVATDDFARAWPLARELFLGVSAALSELDADIARAAVNWTVARMSPVDRGLIRLAYYEMLRRDEIPLKVSLNEALEIARIFGDVESGAFINGILDCLMRGLSEKNSNPRREYL